MKTNWPTKKLGEICEVFADGDWVETKDQSRNGIRLIQTGNIGRLSYIHKDGRARYISEQTFKRLGCTEVFPEDILISRLPDPVGRACIIPHLDTRMVTSVDCTIIRSKSKIVMREYLLYFTESPEYRSQIVMLLSGSTRKRISKSNLAEIKIPLPPLEIQEKIVKKIEELFAKIDQAQSLRESATQDTDDLIPATLSKIFEEGKKKRWEEKELGEVFVLNYGKGLSRLERSEDGKYIVYGANGELGRSDKYLIEGDSIIIGRKGSAGEITRVSGRYWPTDVTYFVTRGKKYDIGFAYYLFKFLNFPQYAAGVKPGINRNQIYEIKIPLPSLPEQKKIVARMDVLTQKVRELQTLQIQTASDLTTLKQSILHKAFQGEL